MMNKHGRGGFGATLEAEGRHTEDEGKGASH